MLFDEILVRILRKHNTKASTHKLTEGTHTHTRTHTRNLTKIRHTYRLSWWNGGCGTHSRRDKHTHSIVSTAAKALIRLGAGRAAALCVHCARFVWPLSCGLLRMSGKIAAVLSSEPQTYYPFEAVTVAQLSNGHANRTRASIVSYMQCVRVRVCYPRVPNSFSSRIV